MFLTLFAFGTNLLLFQMVEGYLERKEVVHLGFHCFWAISLISTVMVFEFPHITQASDIALVANGICQLKANLEKGRKI